MSVVNFTNTSLEQGKRLQFLHIPKTGGSAIKHALAAHAGSQDASLEFHRHQTRLIDIPVGLPVGLVVRDPVSRFVSAFFSRKRKGQPRYHSAWNEVEQQVFATFETPRELAEALGDASSLQHPVALSAMEGIGHFRSLGFWLGNVKSLKDRLGDIKFVGFQESLTDDFERLKKILGLPVETELPFDDVLAHRNPRGLDNSLSSAAIDAIWLWYQADYELIEILRAHSDNTLFPPNCEAHMSDQHPGGVATDRSKVNLESSNQSATHVVAVLGSGRSGTSLLMQVLRELGMSSGKGPMVEASGANPEGFFEDADIVDAHKALYDELGISLASPLPEKWSETAAFRNARKRLRQIVQQRVDQAGDNIWGFKDPRTTSFMPLWLKLFNQPGLKPRYLVAVRDPASVIASLRDQTQRDDYINELLWIRRNVEALHHTAGNCFIVHYEDWFERPEEVVRGLLSYTGLDRTFQGDASEVVNRVVQARLNRAPRQHQDVKVHNPCVIELYETLKKCRGEDFDHVELMNSVERARRIMTGFDAVAKTNIAQQKKVAPRDDSSHKAELAALAKENGQLLRELTTATKEAENLRTNLSAKQRTASTPSKQPIAPPSGAANRQKQQIQRLKRELKATRQSYSFKIGWIIVNAIKKPGMNTLKAPFRLAKLCLRFFRSRSKA